MTVAVSLVPYSAAYAADAGVEALRQFRRGSPLGALLFLPNITRAFFVIVMSSGAAAAIGVPEGISVILSEAALLPTLGDRLIVFAIGIVLFGIPLQLGLAFMRWLQRVSAGADVSDEASAWIKNESRHRKPIMPYHSIFRPGLFAGQTSSSPAAARASAAAPRTS